MTACLRREGCSADGQRHAARLRRLVMGGASVHGLPQARAGGLTHALPVCAGHVTAGGSVCIEALTQSGGPEAWRPDL